jgi:hypothetical protein
VQAEGWEEVVDDWGVLVCYGFADWTMSSSQLGSVRRTGGDDFSLFQLITDHLGGLWQRFRPGYHVFAQNMLLGVLMGVTEGQQAQRHTQE